MGGGVERAEPRGPRARQRGVRRRPGRARGAGVDGPGGRAPLGTRQAGLPRVHQYPRAHRGRWRRLPPARHGQERLPDRELHGLRGAAQGQDDAASRGAHRGAPRLHLPARAEERDHHRHRRGRPARRLGGLRAPGGRSRGSGLRGPSVPRPRHLHGRAGPPLLRRGRGGWPVAPAGGGGLRAQVRRRRRGPPARPLQRGPGRDVQRAAAPGRQGRGARAGRAHPHPRGRQPRRVPAHHGRVPQDADPVPGRHRLPRRAHPARARGLHHRARVDPLSVRRRPARAGRAGLDGGPLPVQVREDGDDAPLLPALPGRGRDAGARHRYLSARHGVGAPMGVHPGQGHRRQLPGRSRPRRLQRGHRRRLPLPGARGPGAPGPGRQGRHPADQPGPRRRAGLRGPDQGAGGRGLRP